MRTNVTGNYSELHENEAYIHHPDDQGVGNLAHTDSTLVAYPKQRSINFPLQSFHTLYLARLVSQGDITI